MCPAGYEEDRPFTGMSAHLSCFHIDEISYSKVTK